MELTLQKLSEALPYASKSNIQKFFTPLHDACVAFDINTPLRLSHFLAQVAHESGSLKYVREIASGAAYEHRADLGNVQKGDGVKFKGRGLIQITGRGNYVAFYHYLKGSQDVISHPELLETPVLASLSAAWFWYTHSLNELADADDIRKITKIINGGYNGFDERKFCLSFAKKAFL